MPGNFLLRMIVSQAPHLAILIVAVQVNITQFGKLGSLIDVASRDTARFCMVMLDNGRDEWSGAALTVGVKNMGSFHYAPAVITAGIDQLDHFPKILTHIPDPRLAGVRIKTEAPGIAEAIRTNFASRARHVDKRIVFRDRVIAARVGVIHVEAHHYREQVVQP